MSSKLYKVFVSLMKELIFPCGPADLHLDVYIESVILNKHPRLYIHFREEFHNFLKTKKILRSSKKIIKRKFI